MWYGSASAAMVVDEPTIEVSASVKMNKRLVADIQGGDIEPYLKMTRALKQTLIVDAIGEMIEALPKIKLTASCSVSIGAVPSAFDIAQAIWQASSSQYNALGSMGRRLNDAGSASNPWTEDLPGSYTGTQAGKVMDDIKKKTNMIPGLY